MQAFENFITAAKSGGGEDMQGNMAGLGAIGFQPTTGLVPAFPVATSQPENPIQARAALGFLLSDRGDFFREFILDEVSSRVTAVHNDLRSSRCSWCSDLLSAGKFTFRKFKCFLLIPLVFSGVDCESHRRSFKGAIATNCWIFWDQKSDPSFWYGSCQVQCVASYNHRGGQDHLEQCREGCQILNSWDSKSNSEWGMHAKLLALFFFSRKRKNIHFVFFLAR
jgi:hypothetical protein